MNKDERKPSTSRFPQEYWRIVELVGEQERTLEIPFANKKEAHNLRQRLYRFRNIAIGELPKVVDGFDNPKVIALDALYITIGPPTPNDLHWRVIISPRSMTPDAQAINAAVEKLLAEEEKIDL